MSNARYLEVDSSYRNRTEWPNAGEFVIPISQSGRKGPVDAVDPVSNSAPEVTWLARAFNITNNGDDRLSCRVLDIVPPGPPGAPSGAGSGNIVYILVSPAGTMQIAKNYYRAAVMVDATPNPAIKARIVSSTYLGTVPVNTGGGPPTFENHDRMSVVLSTTLPIAIGTAVDVLDPTDLSSTTSPLLFVPTGRLAPNSYPNTFIYNQTREEWRPVAGYEAVTHLLQPDTSGSAATTQSSGPTTNWGWSDVYSIRPEVPLLCASTSPCRLDLADWTPPVTPFLNTKRSFNLPLDASRSNLVGSFLEIEFAVSPVPTSTPATLPPAPTVLTFAFPLVINASQMQLDFGSSSGNDDFYVGCQIRLSGTQDPGGERRIITQYVGASRTITVTPPFTVPPNSLGVNRYQIICGGLQEPNDSTSCTQEARRIIKYADYRTTALAVTTNTISFPRTASDVNDYYTGMYIRVANVPPNLRMIVRYVVTRDGTGQVVSRIATVGRAFSPPFAPADTPDFTITSGVVAKAFSFSLYEQHFCLLPFSNDNLNPFVYTGSLVSQQDVVCYEVELLNLVLPNKVLAVAGGAVISFYPYVYVQLMNVDASGGHLKNIIYSNNPNATNMLFRAAVDDVPNPVNSSFIKIDGDGAVQTIKFKPNDNLFFSVHMPNGEVFRTVEPEAYSPCRTNPFTQISAYFSLKRV